MKIPEFKTENVAIEKLKTHSQNYRSHPEDQVKHINKSITKFGIYKNLVVAKDYTILTGHGVLQTAKEMGLTKIPVVVLEVEPDSEDALSVLIGDNEIGKLAEVDDRLLTVLLKQVNDLEGLLGTGFDEMMLANLVMVTRPEGEIKDLKEATEWVGMPEYEASESEFKIIVHFKSQKDLKKFFTVIGQEVSEKNKSIWYPENKEKSDKKSIRFD